MLYWQQMAWHGLVMLLWQQNWLAGQACQAAHTQEIM
jgi:hypothetical protein